MWSRNIPAESKGLRKYLDGAGLLFGGRVQTDIPLGH